MVLLSIPFNELPLSKVSPIVHRNFAPSETLMVELPELQNFPFSLQVEVMTFDFSHPEKNSMISKR